MTESRQPQQSRLLDRNDAAIRLLDKRVSNLEAVTRSLSDSGFIILRGLQIVWASLGSTASGDTLTFPREFSGDPYGVWVTPRSANVICGATTYTSSDFVVLLRTDAGAGTSSSLSYIAIGKPLSDK